MILALPNNVSYYLKRMFKFWKFEKSGTKYTQEVAALRESKKKYQTLFHNAQVALFRTSIEGNLIEINKRYAEIAGYSTIEDCMVHFNPGKAWADPGSREELVRIIREKGSVSDYEARIIRRDGTSIWILFSATIYPEQGYLEGSLIDLSFRKKLEEALKRSESLQRKMVANIGDVIVIIDENGNNTYKSQNVERLFGWKPEELIGHSTWDNIHPEDLESAQNLMSKILKKPRSIGAIDCRYRCKDGSYSWIEFTGSNLMDDPEIHGIIGNYHDITERKQKEQLLLESEARFKALHNASFGGIRIHDKGIILDCNQGLSEITGYSVEELIGMDGLLLIAEESRSTVMNHILSGYEKAYEAVGLHKDGTEYPIRLEARNIPYKGRNVRTVEFRDISESKQAEEEHRKLQDQLTQAQKMESIGRLAGGVAHDFNNMLGIILGNSEMIMEHLDSESPAVRYLLEIQKATDRSIKLTRQLLAYARKQTIAPRVLDLNETIKGILNMLQRLIGEDITLSWLPGKDLWNIKMDPSQVDQILTNLCVNARDSIKDVGKLTIETGNVYFDEEYCLDHEGYKPGEYVMVAVSDNGYGMGKEVLNNLFEPFFTTKKVGEGTGLGLATVYGIVKQNEGFISVYSELKEGTTFRIYFSRHSETDWSTQQLEAKEVNLKGHEIILLVEDEMAILTMTEIMLQRLGYTVIAVSSPDEAIKMGELQTEKISLLITDVVMPEMNGKDLAQKMTSLFPDLKCLFMSGYTANIIANHGILDDGFHFIQKPFSKQELAASVREVLDETSGQEKE
jgi:two-component system cell cycle sensor histidine kinase/response regulator CckA